MGWNDEMMEQVWDPYDPTDGDYESFFDDDAEDDE